MVDSEEKSRPIMDHFFLTVGTLCMQLYSAEIVTEIGLEYNLVIQLSRNRIYSVFERLEPETNKVVLR